MADYVAEVEFAIAEGGQAAEKACKKDMYERQRRFLKRQHDGKARAVQPRKRLRRSAFQWLVGLNNQVGRGNGLMAVLPRIEGTR